MLRLPLIEPEEIGTFLNISTYSYAAHHLVYAGAPTRVSFFIPFVSQFTSYPLVSYNSVRSLATVAAMVINPLSTGETGPERDVEISVYASFREAQFSILRSPSITYSVSRVKRPPKPRPRLYSDLPKAGFRKHGGVITKVDSRSYNITQAESSIVDMKEVGDSFDQKGELSHDVPNLDVRAVVPISFRSLPLVGPVGFTNLTVIDTLGFKPADPARHQAGPADNSEMDVFSIASKWGYLGRFVIEKNDPVGDVLFSTPVVPNPLMASRGYGDEILPTPLERVSQIFHHWRGALEYKFAFSSSGQSFAVTFEANYLSNTVPDEKESQYIFFSRPKPREEIIISVPFLSFLDYLMVSPGAIHPELFQQHALGSLHVRLASALINDKSAPSSVPCTVYVRAGRDFSLRHSFHGIGDLYL